MYAEEIRQVLEDLEKQLKSVVTRKSMSTALGGLVSPRTLANWDALNKGVGVKIRLGRSVGYPKQAVMDWIKKHLTIDQRN